MCTSYLSYLCSYIYICTYWVFSTAERKKMEAAVYITYAPTRSGCNGDSSWFFFVSNTYWVFSAAEKKKMEAAVDSSLSPTLIGYSPLQRGRKWRQLVVLFMLQHILGILYYREEENGYINWNVLFSNTLIGYFTLLRGKNWRQQFILLVLHCWEGENGVLVLQHLLSILHCREEENGGSRWHHFPANKIQKVTYILQTKIRDLRVQNFKEACKEMGFLSFDAVLIMTGPLRKI